MALSILGAVKSFKHLAQNSISKNVQRSMSGSLQAYLNNETDLTVLDNGIKVATEDSGAPTATIGLFVNTGSKYETAANNGVANFVEHLLFKGTDKRTAAQLEAELDSIGARVNTVTSREETAFYATCLKEDVGRCVEILSDVVQNPKFSEADIESARGVILGEMQDVELNLQEVIMDHLHANAFQGTPLANTIMGPIQNVKSLGKEDLMHYVKTHFKGARMVLAGAGGVNHTELCQLADQHFGKITNEYEAEIPMDLGIRYTGSEVRMRDDSMPFAHVAVGIEGCSFTNPDYFPLTVAANVMGAYDRSMNIMPHRSLDNKIGEYSMINHETWRSFAECVARENMVSSYQTFNLSYKNTGLWGLYFISNGNPGQIGLADFQWQFHKKWMQMCTSLTEFEVERAKNALKTNMLLHLDGTAGSCEDIGRQMLCYGKRYSPAEMVAKVDNVDASLVRDVCFNYLYDQDPVIAAIGPIEGLESYGETQKRMRNLRGTAFG